MGHYLHFYYYTPKLVLHFSAQISAGLALGHAEFKGQLRMCNTSIVLVHTWDLLCDTEFRHHR